MGGSAKRPILCHCLRFVSYMWSGVAQQYDASLNLSLRQSLIAFFKFSNVLQYSLLLSLQQWIQFQQHLYSQKALFPAEGSTFDICLVGEVLCSHSVVENFVVGVEICSLHIEISNFNMLVINNRNFTMNSYAIQSFIPYQTYRSFNFEFGVRMQQMHH